MPEVGIVRPVGVQTLERRTDPFEDVRSGFPKLEALDLRSTLLEAREEMLAESPHLAVQVDDVYKMVCNFSLLSAEQVESDDPRRKTVTAQMQHSLVDHALYAAGPRAKDAFVRAMWEVVTTTIALAQVDRYKAPFIAGTLGELAVVKTLLEYNHKTILPNYNGEFHSQNDTYIFDIKNGVDVYTIITLDGVDYCVLIDAKARYKSNGGRVQVKERPLSIKPEDQQYIFSTIETYGVQPENIRRARIIVPSKNLNFRWTENNEDPELLRQEMRELGDLSGEQKSAMMQGLYSMLRGSKNEQGS